jgi:hypothetical protein
LEEGELWSFQDVRGKAYATFGLQWIDYHRQAEVLGKRVVVQHLPLGGLLEWNVAGAPSVVGGSPRGHIWVSGTSVNAASSDTLVNEVSLGSSSASISEGRSAEPSFHRLLSHPKGS